MGKKLTQKEIEKKESFPEDYLCMIENFKVSVTSRQYKVNLPDITKQNGNKVKGATLGYYPTLRDAIKDIKDQLMRYKIKGADTLTEVMKRMEEFNLEFNKIMEKLQTIEEVTKEL